MLPTIALLLSLSSPDVLLLAAPPANPSTPLVASGDDKDDQDKSGKTKDDKGKAKADKSKADKSKAKSSSSDQGVGKKVLSFKAKDLDGKEVDFPGDYKGKLVLLDFWATWCGPCMAEVPHVVEAYQKLHDKGFEVVGISFDQDKEKLERVTKEKGMTWPQYFDGKGWKNAFGVKYGIHGIPEMWLVNKQGKVVTTNARRDLAAQVEKLLAE